MGRYCFQSLACGGGNLSDPRVLHCKIAGWMEVAACHLLRLVARRDTHMVGLALVQICREHRTSRDNTSQKGPSDVRADHYFLPRKAKHRV